MGQFGIFHWLIVGFIFLLFFGSNRLPEAGRSFGKAIRGFKEGLNTIDAEATPIEEPRKNAQEDQTQTTKKDSTRV